MAQGFKFVNANDKAVISSDTIGYEYHSQQTQADIHADSSDGFTGTLETYRVNTGDSTNPPLVFVTNTGLSIEPADSVYLSNTDKMISVVSIKPIATGKWDIMIRRGHDKRSGSTRPITFLFFKRLPSYTPSGWGLVTFDSSHQPTYDSSRKMLMPRVFGSYGGTYSAHTISYKKIDNYKTILSALSITKPAFMISGNLSGRETQHVGYGYYCSAYHHTLFGLYSDGIATFYGRVGHNSDNTTNPDSCAPSTPPDHLGTLASAGAFTFMIIDADDY